MKKAITDAKDNVPRPEDDISVDVESRFVDSKAPGEGEPYALKLKE